MKNGTVVVNGLLFVSICGFFASVVPFLSGLWVPPVWVPGAVITVTTLTADRVSIFVLWSTLGVVRVSILEVLVLHILASIIRFATHADLHEIVLAVQTVHSSFPDFQKAASLIKINLLSEINRKYLFYLV